MRLKLTALALFLALTAVAEAFPLPMPTCSPDDTPCVIKWTCQNTGRCSL